MLERGFTVADVAARIGIPKHTLYDWVQKAKKAGKAAAGSALVGTDSAEIRRLKAELRRVTEERDILKKGSSLNTGEGCADFQEEVFLVAIAVGAALDDLDGVVDALDDARVEPMSAAGNDSMQVGA